MEEAGEKGRKPGDLGGVSHYPHQSDGLKKGKAARGVVLREEEGGGREGEKKGRTRNVRLGK